MSGQAPHRLAGVMGWPVAHSRSPLIHGHWLAEHGVAGEYRLLPVEPGNLALALKNLHANGFAGCNLTLPHKVAAMPMMDTLDAVALAIGAVNTVVVGAHGELLGRNTDAWGYLHNLRDTTPDWQSHQPAVMLGAGGAARAVAYALGTAGVPEVRIVNRSANKAQELAQTFTQHFAATTGARFVATDWSDLAHALKHASLLVNTTDLGMSGQAPLAIDLSTLPAHAVVSDIVYTPLRTQLLASASQRGLRTSDGLGMLLHQARAGFQAWFGPLPQVTALLRQRVEASLAHPPAT